MKRKFLILTLSFINMFCFTLNYAQNTANKLEFNKIIHDFGTFDIKDGFKQFTFTFINKSDKPVVIQTVVSSCGCTTPSWTKKPILPGESGEIHVKFLNDQGAYPFEKTLSVYISENSKPIILKIRGIVKDKSYKFSDKYSHNIGPLKMRTTKIDAGLISKGIKKEFQIEVFNSSKKSITISPENLSKGLSIESRPVVIPAESIGILSIIINPSMSFDWGNNVFSAVLNINGKLYSSQKLELSCIVIDNFSKLSQEQITNAPLPMVVSNNNDFGIVKKGSIAHIDFAIKNYGSSVFKIHKIEANNIYTKINYQSSTMPGKTSKISVYIDTKTITGKINNIITLITNAPSRPQMILTVMGFVD